MATINLGVDLGGTGVRGAFAEPGQSPTTVELSGVTWPWLLCEPNPGHQLPVGFPSLKSRIGLAETVRAHGEDVDPVGVLGRALAALRTRALTSRSDRIGHTVISVPARYHLRQRQAVLDAAAQPGLGEVGLVTDSVAAAVQHMGDGGEGALLVYAMGYSGFELGLVRADGPAFHPLGYEGAASPGGSTWDSLVLLGWFDAARRAGNLEGWSGRGEFHWRWLRDRAERLKEELASDNKVMHPFDVPGPDGRPPVQGDRPGFHRHIQTLLSRTVDHAQDLLRRAESLDDPLSGVLLVGGATRMPAVRELAEGLGSPVVPTSRNHLSLGALRCAHQCALRSATVPNEPPPPGGDRTGEDTVDDLSLGSDFFDPDGPESTAASAASALDGARRLIADDRIDEADEVLRRLADESRRLLDSIASRRRSPTGPEATRGARLPLVTAREHLRAGRYPAAIGTIHAAWREIRDPRVFAELIDIHCRAAMADPTPASFATDLKWLQCALRNDPDNPRVRDLLAQRNYLHAIGLHRAGDVSEAKRIIEHALSWNPEHPGARALALRLNQRR